MELSKVLADLFFLAVGVAVVLIAWMAMGARKRPFKDNE